MYCSNIDFFRHLNTRCDKDYKPKCGFQSPAAKGSFPATSTAERTQPRTSDIRCNKAKYKNPERSKLR